VCLKFDSSPTRAKSIPAGSLDLRRDRPAILWLFGADGELAVIEWDHAYLDSFHYQPKWLFGVMRGGSGALRGFARVPVVHRQRAKGLFGALRFDVNEPMRGFI
jgi:hypothetical protein